MKTKCNLVSLRLIYFMFIGYLKTGSRDAGGGGGSSEPTEPPLDPPLVSADFFIVSADFFTISDGDIVTLVIFHGRVFDSGLFH